MFVIIATDVITSWTREKKNAMEKFVDCAVLDDAANRDGGSLDPIDKDFKKDSSYES